MESYTPVPPQMICPKKWRKPAKQSLFPSCNGSIPSRNNISCTSLIDVEFLHHRLDLGRNLTCARAGTYNCDALSSQIVIIPPFSSMPLCPLKLLYPWYLPPFWFVELTASVNDHIRHPQLLLLCRSVLDQNLPHVSLLIPSRLDDFRIE